MNPRSTGSLTVMVVSLLAGVGRGQSDDRLAGTETLRRRLAELDSRIEDARSSLGELRRAHANEVESLRDRRSTLAGEAVQLELRKQRLGRQLSELDQEVERASRRAAGATRTWSQVRDSAIVLADQLAIYRDEIPGHHKEPGTAALQPSLSADDDGDPVAAYGQLADRIEALDAEAQSVTVKPVELRTAAGRLEKVDLLSVGHVGFAYRTGERLGVALASPADADGYRWREDLPGDLAARWRQAFAAASGETAEPLVVPLDVTGRMRRDAALDRPGLSERLAAGGPVMWPLAVVAVLCLLLLVERYWMLFVRNASDTKLSSRVIAAIGEGEPDRALDLARRRNSSVARVLAALLARRHAGQHAMEDSVQEQLLHELPRLNRFLRGISILAAVAPLLGLLGTVTGIIETFTVIRAVGNTAPGLMAGGISEALLTTATGLTIAIPVVLLNGVLRARVDRILAESEEQAASVLNVLAHDRPEFTTAPEDDHA